MSESAVYCFEDIAAEMPTTKKLGLCLEEKCECGPTSDVGFICKFRRCANCDMPVDITGRSFGPLIELASPRFQADREDCPECGGPCSKL